MQKPWIVVAYVSALVLCAHNPQKEAVEIPSEPSHHQVLQNDFIRVFDVTVAPKATTLVHIHHSDYLFVTLGDSDLINARTGAQPAPLKLKDGEIRFTPGNFSHAAINVSDKPFHNLTIELLKPSTGVKTCTDACAMPLPCAVGGQACPTAERKISSDQWNVASVYMPPGSALEKHTHTMPHFVVAVSDLDLTQDVGGEIRKTKIPAGGYAWVPAGLTHTLTNSGTLPARFVAIDFGVDSTGDKK
jgi:quercetin dioxygenase-like cupin family protein